MKFIKGFTDFKKVSEELKYHVDNGIYKKYSSLPVK